MHASVSEYAILSSSWNTGFMCKSAIFYLLIQMQQWQNE